MWSPSKKVNELLIRDIKKQIRSYSKSYHIHVALLEEELKVLEELSEKYDELIEAYKKQGEKVDEKGFISFYDRKGNLLTFELRDEYYDRKKSSNQR